MHEIMVSEEEANHCVKRGDYFSILPMLPELLHNNEPEPNALDGEFSSADTLLGLEGTIDLLRINKLMIEDVQSNNGELLR